VFVPAEFVRATAHSDDILIYSTTVKVTCKVIAFKTVS